MAEKSLSDRVAEKEAQLKKAMSKTERCKAELKRLKNRKESEERKERTHKLVVCGAEIASLYDGHVLELDEVHALVNFLREQKKRGIFTIPNLPQQPERISEPKSEKQEEIWNEFFGPRNQF